MTDIIDRLRGPAPSIPAMRDAAGEIERLRRQVDTFREAAWANRAEPAHDDAVVERVAKAIYLDNGQTDRDWDVLSDSFKNDFRICAVRAIAATPAQSPLLNEAAEVLQDILNMLRAAHIQCGVHHDGNKRVIRARALLSKLDGTMTEPTEDESATIK